MSLKQHGFFNFDELRKKEFEKKLIVISPNAGASQRNNLKNNMSMTKVIGFLEEVPRISGTANWKSYSELFSDKIGDIGTLKDSFAAMTGSTDYMYGDLTSKFFTGGGEFSFNVTFRCVSYTPWEELYSGVASPIEIGGKKFLIGDCRSNFNSILSLCFPGYTTNIVYKGFKSGVNSLINAGKTHSNNKIFSINDNHDEDSHAGLGKDMADAFMSGFTNNQPTVSVSIGHGDVLYFASNKMIVKSVESVYSEEWVKLDKNTPPVPMYVDVTSQLELSQIAGLTDFANSGNVIQINFADVPNEKKKK